MTAARQRIDLVRHLEFFVALADELHFGRAAEVVGVSQPPLSQGLRRLESRLGSALFERDSRGVRLTPAGTALLPHARRILDDVNALHSAAADTGRKPVGLRMGVLPQLPIGVVAQLVTAARHRLAGRRVELITAPTARLLEDVAAARLDVAIANHPAPLAGLQAGPVVRLPSRLLIAADNALAQQSSLSISLRSLAPQLPLALPPRAHHPAVHDQLLDAVARFGVRISTRHADDDRAALLIAASGVAATLTADVTLNSPGVASLPIDGDPLPLRVRIIRALDADRLPPRDVIDGIQDILNTPQETHP